MFKNIKPKRMNENLVKKFDKLKRFQILRISSLTAKKLKGVSTKQVMKMIRNEAEMDKKTEEILTEVTNDFFAMKIGYLKCNIKSAKRMIRKYKIELTNLKN